MRHFTRAELELALNHFSGERLPGVGPQDVHEVSTVQRYTIGSRKQIGDKVYHYALVGAGGALAAGAACKVRNQQDFVNQGIPALGARAAGAMNLLLAVTVPDGPAQDGSFPLNYLRGGTVICRVAGPTSFVRGITGNPVKAGGVGTLAVTLDAPVPAPGVAVGDQQEVMASRYANVVNGPACIAPTVWTPVAGIPTIDAIAGDYLWLQTWGPCVCIGGFAAPNGPGTVANDLGVYANGGDGALRSFAQDAGSQQYIGHILSTLVAGAQGAPFVNLMIDP